jgi:hypothetical protein
MIKAIHMAMITHAKSGVVLLDTEDDVDELD